MKEDFIYPKILTLSNEEDIYNIDLYYGDDLKIKAPKITFISAQNDQFIDQNNNKISGSDLIKKSFSNLEKVQIKIEDGIVKGETYLYFDKAFASEKILDKSFIKEIEKHLNSKRLLISIPVRDTLLICSSDDKVAKEKLISLTHKLFHDFTKEAISQLIFHINEGLIESVQTPSKSFEVKDNEISLGTYKDDVSKIKLFEELYNFRVLVEADNIGDLQNGIMSTTIRLLRENEGKDNFERKVEIISSSKIIKRNKTNSNKIIDLFNKISDVFIIKSSNPITLTFQFHEDYIEGNNHIKLIKTLKQ